jgi:hypothetical protein
MSRPAPNNIRFLHIFEIHLGAVDTPQLLQGSQLIHACVHRYTVNLQFLKIFKQQAEGTNVACICTCTACLDGFYGDAVFNLKAVASALLVLVSALLVLVSALLVSASLVLVCALLVPC